MRNQQEIDSLLQQLIAQYAGQRPDYYGYAGECLSLVKRWVDVVRNGNLNGAMGAPPSTDGWGSGYWSQPPEVISELFEKQGYDGNAIYPAGSLFVNVRTHHIGILLDNQPGSNYAHVFQQNANPDGSAAHTGDRLKANIDGILVLKVAAPQPVVTHQITDYSSPIKYNVAEGYNEWDLSGNTFAEVASHPVDTAGPNKVIDVQAVLHIQGSDLEQYQYYLEDRNSLRGWNSADCSPYVAPAKPYQPPAKPIEIPGVTYYTVLPDVIKSYATADDAKRDNPTGVKAKGQYIELQRDGQAVKLVKSNSDINGDFWVNDYENKVDKPAAPALPVVSQPVDAPPILTQVVNITPTPTADKLNYGWIRDDHQPVWFHTLNVSPQVFKDLEHPDTVSPASLPANKNVRFSMWTQKGNVTYFIPTLSVAQGNRHGIPETILHEIGPDLPQPNILTTVEEDTKTWFDFIETEGKRAYTLIRDITPVKISQTTVKAKQFIDGFKAGRK